MENTTISRNIVLSSLMWKGLEKIFSQGSNLIIQIILARLLLPSDFGSLAIIVALVNYISVFVESGLSTAIIQKKDVSQKDINTLFTVSICAAFICYLFFYFFSPYIASYYNNPDLVKPIRVAALVLFLYSYNSIQLGLLSRGMEFKVIFFRTAIAVPMSGFIGIYLAYHGFGLWSLIVNFVLNILIATIVMAIFNKTKVGIGFSIQSAKELYSFSIKILGASLISGFGDLFRTMSIGKKYTTEQLAYYDRAYTYASVVLQIVTNSIQSVLLPVFSREQDNIEHLKTLSRKSIRITVFFVTPLLLGAAILSKPLFLVLLTEKWLPAVPFFMLFCIFRWAGCVVGIDKQVILALGKSSIIMYFEAFLLCSNIIMLLITIPISIKAIAIGALIVEYTGSLVIVLVSIKLYNYTLRERLSDLLKPLLNSIIMAVAMFLVGRLGQPYIAVGWLLLILIFTGLAVYYILVNITKDNSCDYIKQIVKDKFKQIRNHD